MKKLLIAVLAIAVLSIGMRSLRVRAMGHYVDTQRYEDVYYVPPPSWLRVFSLGHDEAVADLLWCKALVYFGDELVHRGEVVHVFDYGDAILELDPEFRIVYHWVGMAGMYNAGELSEDDLRRSISFLERGARRFPDDGDMAWDLGASLAWELAPHVEDEDEWRRVRLAAVEHLQTAARLGAAPDWLVFTNAAQLRRLGETEQAIRHLTEMYATVDDPSVLAQIRVQLEQLQSRSYADALQAAHDDFVERWQRDFRYLPPSLYLHTGSRPPLDPHGGIAHGWLPPETQIDLEPGFPGLVEPPGD